MLRTAGIGLLLVGLLGLGFSLGIYFQPWVMKYFDSTTGKYEGKAGSLAGNIPVHALGKFQPTNGVISIFGLPGDRVAKMLVKQGQSVKKDTPLVELTSKEDREKERKLATIQLEDAQKQLASIVKSRDVRLAEIKDQKEALKKSRVLEVKGEDLKINFLQRQYDAALAQQKRLASLDPSVVRVSAQERDQVDLAVSQARSELRAAEAAKDASKTKYELATKSADNQEKVAKAEYALAEDRVPIRSLEESVELAKERVNRSTLKSPVEGTILRILTREGDTTGPEPILQIAAGQTDEMAVIAEVYAADVERLEQWLKKGAVSAKITSPALGSDVSLSGTVSSPKDISRAVARNAIAGFSARADSDRRVVEVKITLDGESAKQASRFIGLEVNVELPHPK